MADPMSTNRPAVPEGAHAARDLTTDEPRPFGLELEGYAHVPRMLDKARATLAGTAGAYVFGCPVDHTCMARLGVAPDLVLDLAARYADDGRVLEALREHRIPSASEAWFDAAAVEDELQEGTYLRVRSREELPESGAGRVFAGAEHGADVDVVLVEVAPGEGGGAPDATAAQVWVIQEGQATFSLGERQARVVRAGEVVRIPADVPWRFENTGAGPLRAVAVGPAQAR
jgi:mannose-6-phosphate isomerase-like protein (cupin superfamily)